MSLIDIDLLNDDFDDSFSNILNTDLLLYLVTKFKARIKEIYQYGVYYDEKISADTVVIYEHSESAKNGLFTLYNDVEIPFTQDNVIAVFCVGPGRIKYMYIQPIDVWNDNGKVYDNEYYIINFLNEVYEERNITADTVIFNYSDNNKFFVLELVGSRAVNYKKKPFSEEFCKYLPKIVSSGGTLISDTIKLLQCSIENEKAMYLLINRLIDCGFKKIYVNCSTCYVKYKPLYSTGDFSDKFNMDIIKSHNVVDDIDQYIILTAKLNINENMNNRVNYNAILNAISRGIKNSLSEAWGDDFDRKNADPLVDDIMREIGDKNVKYSTIKMNKVWRDETGALLSFTCKASVNKKIKTPAGFYVKRIYRTGFDTIDINIKDFDENRLNIPYKTPVNTYIADYIVLAVVVRDKEIGDNPYDGYVFKKQVLLDVFNKLQEKKKLSKGKLVSIKDRYGNELISNTRVKLSKKFLDTAVQKIESVYYSKTKSTLNKSYDIV